MSKESSGGVQAATTALAYDAVFQASSQWQRLGRGLVPALVAIALNALVQSLLTYWNPSIGMNPAYVIALVLSFAALVFFGGLLARTALESAHGKVGLSAAISGTLAHLPTIALWLTVLVLLVTLAVLINPLLSWLVILVLAYVPLAAADGKANALALNFKVIGERWVRWLVSIIAVLIVMAIMFLLNTVNVLFVKGFPASLIGWLGIGLVAWWILTAWAETYRSTEAGRVPHEAG